MKLLFLGDLFYDFEYIADDIYIIAEYIKKEGFDVILNLEGPITMEQDLKIKKRGEHLKQNYNVLKVLSMLNVKGVTLSNNHTFDYLDKGYFDTIRLLKENGIQYTGVIDSKRNTPKGILLDDGEECYEIFAATDPFEESICRTNKVGCTLISDLVTLDLKETKKRKRIAFLHTGFEYNTVPTLRTIRECRKLVDVGFECVICSHPHVVQPFEVYNDKKIFYSIGNFYFSGFRKEFSNKMIRNKPEHYCDLGYGIKVCMDKTDVIGIKYNPEINKSIILPKINPIELGRVDKLLYKITYYKNRNNHNFLLTGHRIFDTVKMSLLNCIYLIYRKVKQLE